MAEEATKEINGNKQKINELNEECENLKFDATIFLHSQLNLLSCECKTKTKIIIGLIACWLATIIIFVGYLMLQDNYSVTQEWHDITNESNNTIRTGNLSD